MHGEPPAVGFVGLGAIGAPMARHLAAATRLTVWNRTESVAAEFGRATAAKVAGSARDVANGAEFLILCLPASSDVEDALFERGVADGLAMGSVVVDCTSGDPAGSRRIAARLAEREVSYLDAPVSGGTSGAVAGKLTVMVGGDAAVLERARPILELFAGKIVHCGPVGAGAAVKAVNNALLAVHIWSAAEGLAALSKMGVDATVALEVINGSSGRSNTSMNLFPERVIGRCFPRTFRLALLDKDVRIAASMAHDLGTPSELIDATSELFRMARAELGEEADHVEAVKVVERRGGTTIQ